MKSLQALFLGMLVLITAALAFLLLQDRRGSPGGEIESRLDALSKEVARMRSEVVAMKGGEIGAEQREAILRVIAEDRLAENSRREEAGWQSMLQLWHSRADRAAQRHGLTAEQQRQLADLLLAYGHKLREVAQLLDPSHPADGDAMLEAYGAVDAWRVDELTKQLGPEIAERVNQEVFAGVRGN